MRWADGKTFDSLKEFGRVIGASLLLTVGAAEKRKGRVAIVEISHHAF